jgi:hypothetical protein
MREFIAGLAGLNRTWCRRCIIWDEGQRVRPEESGSLMSCWANAGDTGPCYWTENSTSLNEVCRALCNQPRVVDAAGLLITLRIVTPTVKDPSGASPTFS